MSVIDRIVEHVLPSQEFMAAERDYIRRTGHSPSKEQQKRIKASTKRAKQELRESR